MASNVFAADANSILGDLDKEVKTANVDTGSLMPTFAKVVKFLRNISILATVIMIIVIGLKYITGSAEQKADYMKSFIPLLVGAILVVGATSIASFIFSIM